MNNKSKRYRQRNLFECFVTSKKTKINSDSMDDTSCEKPPFSVSEQKVKHQQSDIHSLTSVCQAAKDSTLIKSERYDAKEGTSVMKTEYEEQQHSDDGFENSGDLFPDSMWIMAENDETIDGTSFMEKEMDEHQQSDDGFAYSDDLFPCEPSLENYSVPSSSHSAELFPDPESESSPDSDELDEISFLNTMPDCSLPLPKLESSLNHSVLFFYFIRPEDAPRPYPSSYRDKWDSDHVRMPCSPLNRYPVVTSLGEKRIESRWNLICRSLRSDIGSSKELEDAIMKYNRQYIGKWNFEGLHVFINEHLNEAEQVHFFEDVLPAMIKMALDLPHICTQPIPLLKSGKDRYITMSQKQIGCLLLNAFFCTFPRRTLPCRYRRKQRWPSEFEYATYPDINFNRLFYGVRKTILPKIAEKLKCLLNYFKRITSVEPTGTVTFHRQCLETEKLPIWKASTRGIRTAVIRSSGLIETVGEGMLQVDFANKYVGGGVLSHGCVQEEIRFVICPELIISRLFVECLDKNEVLIVTGVEQYNKYSGYAESFKWEGDFRDETPRDSWGRMYTQVVAMDATSFSNPDDQFKILPLKRELNKAYCGFYEDGLPAHLPAIATGNWGCGAFKGNAKLKFLIQLIAASEAGRSLLYFTFGNKKLKTELEKMYEFITDKNLAIGDVWRLLLCLVNNVSLSNMKEKCIYEFIYSQCVIKEENSREKDDGSSEKQLNDSDKKALNKLFEDVAFGGSSTEIEDT